MSWSLFVVPLHRIVEEDMAAWARSAEFVRGVPGNAPPVRPLPSVVNVLDAFRSAGCHGSNWFQVDGEDAGARLPECPGSNVCLDVGGLDLGEVSVYSPGQASSLPPIPADARVEMVTFRKPNTAAVLRAVCALAKLAGPQLVFDSWASDLFAVWPGEDADRLEGEWPW